MAISLTLNLNFMSRGSNPGHSVRPNNFGNILSVELGLLDELSYFALGLAWLSLWIMPVSRSF
jgi:hypothetical protein